MEETVRSVLAQTYQNWELLFVDDYSSDDTLQVMMNLMHVDENAQKKSENPMVASQSYGRSRIRISHTTNRKEDSPLRNQALKEANGRWIAVLDAGDVCEPTKLERQIAFMEEHGYAFSYTKYGLIGSRVNTNRSNLTNEIPHRVRDEETFDRGVEIGGKEHVTHEDMMKCCWPAYMTVMYDAVKVGKVQVRNLKENNDYALWLNISEKADCYLLDKNLAKMRTPWGMMGRLLLTNKIKWRYEVYRIEENLNPFVSGLMTLRNMWYGLVKWGGMFHEIKFEYNEGLSISYIFAVQGVSVRGACGSSAWIGDGICDRQGR